jgi:hypothetical protein
MASLIKRFLGVFRRQTIGASSESSRKSHFGKVYLFPQTRFGNLAVSGDKDQIPLSELAEQLAEDLYRNELRYGGWAIDVGLLGSNLFVDDAAPASRSDGSRL